MDMVLGQEMEWTPSYEQIDKNPVASLIQAAGNHYSRSENMKKETHRGWGEDDPF